MALTKARSRLQKVEEKKSTSFSHNRDKKVNNKKLKLISQKLKIKEHLKYSLSLVLSLLSFYSLYLLCKNFYPEQIQNLIVKNGYLPFFLLFFISNFFFFTFIFLNKKIGLLISFILSFSLYLKLIEVKFNLITILTVVIVSLLLFFILFTNFSRNKE